MTFQRIIITLIVVLLDLIGILALFYVGQNWDQNSFWTGLVMLLVGISMLLGTIGGMCWQANILSNQRKAERYFELYGTYPNSDNY